MFARPPYWFYGLQENNVAIFDCSMLAEHLYQILCKLFMYFKPEVVTHIDTQQVVWKNSTLYCSTAIHSVVAFKSCLFLFQWQHLWSYFCGELLRKVRNFTSVRLLCHRPYSIKI
jgi:hypothetical protein